MKFSEILFTIAMLGLLLVPSAIFGQWWLFSAFLIFGVIFGLLEWIAIKKTGKSVSQHFWDFSLRNKTGAILILTCMAFAWMILILHLAGETF